MRCGAGIAVSWPGCVASTTAGGARAQPERQREDLNDLLVELSRTGGDDEVIVWFVKVMLCGVERYLGMVTEALTRSEDVLRSARSSLLWQIPRVRVGIVREFVACAVAHCRETGNLDSLREAEAMLAELPVPASGMDALLRACIANVRDDRDEALRLVEIAISDPGRVGALSVALTARLFQGLLLGGPRGEALLQEAKSEFSARAFPLSWKLVNAVWPGFGDQIAPFTQFIQSNH